MKGAGVIAGSVVAVQVSEWVHGVAGVAGDVGVVVATVGVMWALGRRVARAAREGWEDIAAVRSATHGLPAFIDEQRRVNKRQDARLAALEQRVNGLAEVEVHRRNR